MNLPPDQSPSSAPAKPKLSPEERRARQADRLVTIRLRMAIGRELDDRGITAPADIDAALGMPAAEAVKLLTRHQWREGDVVLLQAAAALEAGARRLDPHRRVAGLAVPHRRHSRRPAHQRQRVGR
jgi:hypothetical protein